MRPENRALVNLTVAVAVIVGFVGGYLVLSPYALGSSLPIPAGTVFSQNDTEHWVAHFTVGPGGGRLTGAWTAYDVSGFVSLVVVNGTVDKPWPPPAIACPLLVVWQEMNGTIDRALAPGSYTIYWSTGFCSTASQIRVTQAIQIESP